MGVLRVFACLVLMGGLVSAARADDTAESRAKAKQQLRGLQQGLSKTAGSFFRAVANAVSGEKESRPTTPKPVVRTTLPASTQPADIDEKATHEQTALIKLKRGGDDSLTVNAFCLSGDGDILAALGDGPGEVRVFDGEGELLRYWEVAIKPEAINTAPDGTVLVAGSGKIFRFSPEGELLKQAEAPHAVLLRESNDKLREQAVNRVRAQSNSLASRVASYERVIDQLEAKAAKGELSAAEQQVLKVLPERLELYKKQLDTAPEEKTNEPTEQQIQAQVDYLTQYKLRTSSVSADSQHVYLTTQDLAGYSFNVWKLKPDFTGGEVIVTELRGCCGQMDVQACSNGLFAAENGRHRVVRFDTAGKQTTTWGTTDRTGIDGFTSCCNPMNVCFSNSGEVYTAESNTGRIKRFSPDGELLAFVGDIKLVPGCKNVSIAVSDDDQRVYMLDITRNHIVLMTPRSESAGDAGAAEAEATEESE